MSSIRVYKLPGENYCMVIEPYPVAYDRSFHIVGVRQDTCGREIY